MSKRQSPGSTDRAARKPGLGRAANTAFAQTTRRVQEMHHAIAAKSFDRLRQIPAVSAPARLVEGAHGLIANGVYAAVRKLGGGALEAAIDAGEDLARRRQPVRANSRADAAPLTSALNGAFGDHLAQTDNRLAIPMTLHAEDAELELARSALRGFAGRSGDRVCVFIHGLGCDHRSWRRQSRAAAKDPALRHQHYGAQLHSELGYKALYLHYNTGLPIAQNARELDKALQLLVARWPRPFGELVLIGHSMGGLVARAACAQARTQNRDWLRHARPLVCLGSPQRGATLARLGALTASALDFFKVTQPLGRLLDASSLGVKDLRDGLAASEAVELRPHGVPMRFVAASLAADPSRPLAAWLGDGLVSIGSATAPGLAGDVESVQLGGIDHMSLLNHARVYAQVRAWLAR